MEELLKLLEEKTILLGLTPQEPYLGRMLNVLVQELDLNMYDRQKMEDEIMELRYAPDEEILEYLELEPEELYEYLLPLKTEAEIQEVLVGDLMYQAVAAHLDDFPTNRRITPYEGTMYEG